MQRNNLKMCLRSTDDTTDTSEVAKVFFFQNLSVSSFWYSDWLDLYVFNVFGKRLMVEVELLVQARSS